MIKGLTYFKARYKVLGLLLFSLVTSFYSYGQETEDDEIDLLLDELFFSEDQFIDDILDLLSKRDFIYTNISYHSNTYFSGRESNIDQFNLNSQLSFYHRSGFNLSVSGVYYQEFDPNWDLTNISIGYYDNMGKKNQVQYDIGYTRYIYSDGWDTFTNSLDASIGIRNSNRSVGTELSASYLFGNDQSVQLVSGSYYRVTLARDQNYVIRFKPQLYFIVAKQTVAFLELDSQGDRVIRFNDVFGLLNTQLNLPISLSTRSWDLELGYNINFPSKVEGESNLNTTGFFSGSIGYLFDFKSHR